MSESPIPFDPDFDAPRSMSSPASPRSYFIFGAVAGLTVAAIIGIVLILSS